ncbi:MAG: UvrB/UvrC motif-containing protein [Defluviitaleaceae bacterium]|nr:UvrB/UvrC motif-containing protein [Defluviitaleaceae bacterium]
MICDHCKKLNASVTIEEISVGKKTELNLCYKCSLEYNMEANAPAVLNHVLKHMFYGLDALDPSKKQQKEETLECKCKTTSAEFRKSGKFGCEKCYETFEKELLDIFKSIQRATEHVGKIPQTNENSIKIAWQIKKLEKEQAKAISLEEYEQAAILRDRIRALKRENEENKEDTNNGMV